MKNRGADHQHCPRLSTGRGRTELFEGANLLCLHAVCLVVLLGVACSSPAPTEDVGGAECMPMPGEVDTDGDGVVDRCDTCPSVANPDQNDADHDRLGDLCDDDDDDDNIADEHDVCPLVFDDDQRDSDDDGIGDACDECPGGRDETDFDEDGVDDCRDTCLRVADATNADTDGDGVGDVCDVCPGVPDAGQADSDGDGIGNACEAGPFNIEEATIAQLHDALISGETTCAAVVQQTLERIQRYDLDVSDGPPLLAFVHLNQAARARADELDSHFDSTGELAGPLHCVTIAVKDNVATRDMPTSVGTLGMSAMRSPIDAPVVASFRQQGAVIVGTTSMDELALSIFAVSSRSGRAGNPYAPSLNPGGSSGGSAIAVASSFAMLSTGTDNCSSIVIPASYNGLVALRPSVGLISTTGVWPANPLDTAYGPLARTTADLAVALDAMAFEEPGDALTSIGPRPGGYVDVLEGATLEGRRIGILRRTASATSDGDYVQFRDGRASSHRVYGRALRKLAALGATVVDNVQFPKSRTSRVGVNVRREQDIFLANLDGPLGGYRDFCIEGGYSQFIFRGADACLDPWIRAQDVAATARARTTGEDRYGKNRRHIEAVMDQLSLDAVIYPVEAYGPAQTTRSSCNCRISPVSGLPALVIVVGQIDGLPVGMQLLGRRYDEAMLLAIAHAWEEATGHRFPPRLTTVIESSVAPPLDIDAENEIRLLLGQAAFEEVLETADSKFDLTPSRFTEIAETVVEAHQPWRLGPGN